MIKKIIGVLVIGLLIFICGTSCQFEKTVDQIEFTELGIPAEQTYDGQNVARSVWDMEIFGDKLYIGGGNFDTNAGPVDVWCYDISNDEWEKSGTVPDEEVSRFCLINNSLIVPGVDPQADWSLGNYYLLESNQWKIIRNIPNGLHNFDMVEFDGVMFAGLGVEGGNLPIVCSTDNGQTFNFVEMKKNGNCIDTSNFKVVRVLDLFVFKDNLYATFLYGNDSLSYDLYRYENGEFVFDNEWTQKIGHINYSNIAIGGKGEYKGNFFFTTGYLYTTNDMVNFTRIKFPNSEIVYDLYVENDRTYVLCCNPINEEKYTVSVWENKTSDPTKFSELFNFEYDASPLSLISNQDTFYIGFGSKQINNSKNGMVVRVDLTR